MSVLTTNSLPTNISLTVLDTVLGHLAPHFLASANGDLPTARHAASSMLAAYDVQTEEELHLATEIVSFGFHALAALSHAAEPDLALNKVLRLRGNAVSLSREAHKARRKMDQLKRARLSTSTFTASAVPEAALKPLQLADQPSTDKALGLIEFAREALDASTRTGGIKAWTLSRQQRRAAAQITKNLRRNKAEQVCRTAEAASVTIAAAIPADTLTRP